MHFNKTPDYLNQLISAAKNEDKEWITQHLSHLHAADIAEILEDEKVNVNSVHKFIYFHLNKNLQAEVLMEFSEDVKNDFISSLTQSEVAELLENLNSDDAADILSDFGSREIEEIIGKMDDGEAAADIVDLLSYHEDSAGGLMQKEFIQVNMDWPVNRCLVEMRRQAKNVERVYTIYVVDEKNRLVGFLSLKSLLYANPKTKIKELYKHKNIISVKTTDTSEKVVQTFHKYDLTTIPVVDFQNKLVGRITFDDIVDLIQEEADKDYQMASGLSEGVEPHSSIWRISRARLLWLFIGMFGGSISANVIANFEVNIGKIPALAFFIPLITAMGGNVGVQSSAIVVQSLAKGYDFSNLFKNLLKETLVGLLNGLICSAIILAIATVMSNIELGITVSLSLLIVMLFAAVAGSLIPLALNKWKIDPALATGPFVTTLNDIIGLFIYFTVGSLLIGI